MAVEDAGCVLQRSPSAWDDGRGINTGRMGSGWAGGHGTQVAQMSFAVFVCRYLVVYRPGVFREYTEARLCGFSKSNKISDIEVL